MRKAFGISIAASLALLLAGCGDDSSCESNCAGEPDAAAEDEADEPETDEDDPETTSDEPEAGTPTETDTETETETETDEPTEAGTPTETDTSDASMPDAGPVEAGSSDEEQEEAGAAPGDGGLTTDEPIEAGPVDEPDATTTDGGGGSGPTACELACANAEEKGCSNMDCAVDVCGIRDVNPNCLAEADAYLLCLSEQDPQVAYVCNEDDKPQVVTLDCQDPYYDTWFECIMQ